MLAPRLLARNGSQRRVMISEFHDRNGAARSRTKHIFESSGPAQARVLLGPYFGPSCPAVPKDVTVQLGGHNSASSKPGVWSAPRPRRSMTRGARR